MDKDILVISPYDSPVLELTYTSYDEWMSPGRGTELEKELLLNIFFL